MRPQGGWLFFGLSLILLLLFWTPTYSAEPGNNQKFNAQGVLPLSLQEVIEKSLRNNVSIRVLRFDPRIKRQDITEQKAVFDPTLELEFTADERVDQIASAFALPNVSKNRSLNWNAAVKQKFVTGTELEATFDNRRTETNSSFAGLEPQYSSEINFNLTQPLLKNFGVEINKSNIHLAKNNAKISDLEFKNQVIDIISETENTYWDLVFSIENLRVKQKSLERAQDLERRVKIQVEVGTLAPLEILQAQAEVASREEFVLVARDQIKDNEDILKNLINIEFDSEDGGKEIRPLDRPKLYKEAFSLEKALQTAFQRRPDYQTTKKELENKNIQVRFNQNQLYPSLDLIATLGLNGIAGDAQTISQFGGTPAQSPFGGNYGSAIDSMFDSDFYQWEVGLKLSYPLGNRAARSRLTATKLEAEKLIFEIKDLEKKIIIEVREAVRQLATDKKRVAAARIARRFTEQKLAAEEKKFKVGLSTSFNVLEFQEDLAEEQSKEIQSIIDYNKSIIRLRQVLATTLEKHNIKLADKNKE